MAWGEEPPALLVIGADVAELAGRVAVIPAGALAVPDAIVPMAGRWETAAEGLRFLPRLSFARGVTYALVRADGWTELARLHRPDAGLAPTTSIVAIHPGAAEVPENLLRISVTFSAPMEEGSAAGRIRLLGADGREIPQALLPMPPELWDRARRRLTVLLEPGRIKRGLVPNTALGPPLAHHTEVTVVIDPTIRDATGVPLVAGARRSYRVGPPVRARVDPARWSVTWPAAGEPLVVAFDRPLDQALALRCLRVTDDQARAVPGRTAVDDDRWVFFPETVLPDRAELHVDADLEDLAGNSVRRVFDRDLRLAEDAPAAVDEIVLTSSGRLTAGRIGGRDASGSEPTAERASPTEA